MELKNELQGGETKQGEKVNQKGQTQKQVVGFLIVAIGFFSTQIQPSNPFLTWGLIILGLYLIFARN